MPTDLIATLLDDSTRLYRLQSEGPLAAMAVASWAQREAVDEPWRLELNCLATDARIAPSALLGQRVTLLTRLSDGGEHPRSGIVSSAFSDGSDGGLAHYRLVVEPWLALLTHGTHSRVWQDKTVTEIVESVFGPYREHAAWRWADCVAPFLADSANGGQRSYTVQYRESDLSFVRRMVAREGLSFRFERDDAAPLGHGLVIFANSVDAAACPEDAVSASALGGAGIRFQGTGPVQSQDSIQALGGSRRLPVARVVRLAWDYKTKRSVAAEVPTAAAYGGAQAPALEDYEPEGAYAYADSADAQRSGTLLQQMHEARHKAWLGRSTVRSFTAGEFFHLRGSELDGLDLLDTHNDDDKRFLLLSVTHAGINNLPQRDSAAAAAALPDWVSTEVRAQAAATGYGNAFLAQRAQVPWRAQRLPRPASPGLLTATVVGPAGQTSPTGAQEIHVDRLGRIRIAFDFQRQFAAESTSKTSTWVRVLQRWAGAGMGSQWLPRIGQEVLVDFVDGDIERPLVLGALYNGRGEAGVPATPGGAAASAELDALAQSSDHSPSAQANLSGGHAPAWHGAGSAALSAGGQANAAALSGIKSKEFGGWGFNQMVFDDSDGQLRTQMSTTQYASQITLGHLIHQADNHRGSFRGLGWEVRTDAYAALRGNAGVLISSFGTPPGEPAGDNAAGIALQGQLVQMASALSQAAGTHQAVVLAAQQGSVKAGASTINGAQAPAQALHTVLKGMVDGAGFDQALADAAGKSTATAEGKLPHSGDAVVSVTARAGLAAVAGQDIHLAAGETITLAAGEDTNFASAGAARIHAGQAIGMLGGAIKPGSGAAGTGITLIAGQGDIEVQAQADAMQLAAQGDVAIQSQSAHIDWAAARKITLATSGGASVTLAGGNITVMCPGKISINASLKSFTGAEKAGYAMPQLPNSVCLSCLLKALKSGSALASV